MYAQLTKANRVNPGQRIEASRWAPWNQALAAVNLLADPRIVEAAHQIDALFWELHLKIARSKVDDEEWVAIRARVRVAQLNFVNTVRARIGRKDSPLRKISGRPLDSDPMWRLPPNRLSDATKDD